MKHSLNADRLSAINLCAILALVVICLAFGAAPCAAKIGYISAPSTPDPKSLKATSGNTVVAEVTDVDFVAIGAAHTAINRPMGVLFGNLWHEYLDVHAKAWVPAKCLNVYVNLSKDRVIFRYAQTPETAGIEAANFAEAYPEPGSFAQFYSGRVRDYLESTVRYDKFGGCWFMDLGKRGDSGTGVLDAKGCVVALVKGVSDENGVTKVDPICREEIESALEAIRSGHPERAGYVEIGPDGRVPRM